MRLDRHADLRAHVAAGTPFIATDVLVDSFLAAVDDRDLVIRTFGESIARQRNRPDCTLAEYFAAAEFSPGSITVELPPALETQLTELAQRPPLACAEPGSVVWIGRAGCKQRFHCDMDCAGILLAQAMGTKRVSLVSPMQSQKVQPGIDRNMLLSEVPFQLADDADRLRFLAFVDGFDATLRPGETLFIPPLWWHFVEYLSDSLAISWHLPMTALPEASLAWPLLWKSEWPLWQGIVANLGADPAVATRAREVYRLIAARDRDAAVALRALHDELCPGRYLRLLAPGDEPFFIRRAERPLPAKVDAWRDTDIPRVQPYLRFATSPSALVVIDGSRVISEFALDDETEALATIAMAVAESAGHANVAALAGSLECDVSDLCSVLAQLSARGWIS